MYIYICHVNQSACAVCYVSRGIVIYLTLLLMKSVNILYAIWLEALWYLSLCLHYYVLCMYSSDLNRTDDWEEGTLLHTYIVTSNFNILLPQRNATQRTPHHRPYFQGCEGGEVQGFLGIYLYIWSHGWWESLTDDYVRAPHPDRRLYNIMRGICMAYYPSQETISFKLNLFLFLSTWGPLQNFT